MSKVRICFLGTPDFAVESLKALHSDEHYALVGVITQPDRPAGRKLQLTPSPVKQYALTHGLKVLSPESLKDNSLILDQVRVWGAEAAVVVAFGQILTEEFLKSFPFGCVNLHASLLPRWRGAAPIQRAIEAGDTETGVTLQKMVKRLDAGDVIGVRRTGIEVGEDSKLLYDRLAVLGADLLHVELMDFVRGNLAPTPQNESLVTYAKKIEKAEGLIRWADSAEQIERRIRAFRLGPGTFTYLDKRLLKIHSASVMNSEMIVSHLTQSQIQRIVPGKVVRIMEEAFVVATGRDYLQVKEVQPESRSRMSTADFLKGYSLHEGVVFDHG